MARAFLLFSGHNDRAVVTLCRFFERAGLAFVIVAAGRNDAIHRTAYRDRVIFDRLDAIVSVALLRQIADSAPMPLIYCPTTEFINDFVLRHRNELAGTRLRIGLPDKAVYHRLTSKLASQVALVDVAGLRMPQAMPMNALQPPCVLKPKANVDRNKVLYPMLCRTREELDAALAGIDADAYFAQDYVVGQSYYLCAYLAKSGRRASYWQENLLQQSGGKSIVLARACDNPGFDADALLSHIAGLGHHGPLMIELIHNDCGFHYIEINPRFWGPLQLALDHCPQLLALFAEDHGCAPRAALQVDARRAGHYAWAFGARQSGLKRYPSAEGLTQVERLLREHDIYAGADTARLHDCH